MVLSIVPAAERLPHAGRFASSAAYGIFGVFPVQVS